MTNKIQNFNIQKFVIRHSSFVIVLAVALFLPLSAFAAEVNFNVHRVKVRTGEQFVVDVRMNNTATPLNTLEGEVRFSAELLEVAAIQDGNSVINFWIEKPELESPGLITFSGVTPGGFSGADSHLFAITFQARNPGLAAFSFGNFTALYNDGEGSEANVTKNWAAVAIEEGTGTAGEPEFLNDQDPPEYFIPVVESDPTIFDGKYFLVFATQDKGSGVAEYRVREGELGWFIKTQSPYRLKDQSLGSRIYVKAIDHEGNERLVSLAPSNPKPWWTQKGILGIIILLLCLYFWVKKL